MKFHMPSRPEPLHTLSPDDGPNGPDRDDQDEDACDLLSVARDVIESFEDRP